MAKLEGIFFDKEDVTDLVEPAADRQEEDDPLLQSDEETQDSWRRPEGVAAWLWDTVQHACLRDRATVARVSPWPINRLRFCSPLQILSSLRGVTDPQICDISGDNLTVEGGRNKGMRPSLDANCIIAVNATPDACGVRPRYIHVPGNVNIIPSFANFAKKVYPLSAFFRICQNVAATVGLVSSEPKDMKELERTQPLRAAPELQVQIDERTERIRDICLLAGVAIPYIRVDRGNPVKATDAMIQSFYARDQQEVQELVETAGLQHWTMKYPPGLSQNPEELEKLTVVARKRDRSSVKPKKHDLVGAVSDRLALDAITSPPSNSLAVCMGGSFSSPLYASSGRGETFDQYRTRGANGRGNGL